MTAAAYLFTEPTARPLDLSGAIMPGAKLRFYETGTTQPADTYADADLQTPLPNPVIADADGRFVPIYLDPLTTYRVLLFDDDDALHVDEETLSRLRDGGFLISYRIADTEFLTDFALRDLQHRLCVGAVKPLEGAHA